jgi:hypothetical protein
VVTISSKSQLLVAAASGGKPNCSLSQLMMASTTTPSGRSGPADALTNNLPQTITWQETISLNTSSSEFLTTDVITGLAGGTEFVRHSKAAQQVEGHLTSSAGSLQYHVVIRDDDHGRPHPQDVSGVIHQPSTHVGVLHTIHSLVAATKIRAGRPEARSAAEDIYDVAQGMPDVAECMSDVTDNEGSEGTGYWIIIDADDSQLSPAPSGSAVPETLAEVEKRDAAAVTNSAEATPSDTIEGMVVGTSWKRGAECRLLCGHRYEVIPSPSSKVLQKGRIDDHISSYTPISLFSALVGMWGRRCLALVQNVHFLPFGPSGTGPRSQNLIQVLGSKKE